MNEFNEAAAGLSAVGLYGHVPPDAPPHTVPEPRLFKQTDLGNAQRLIHWHGREIRYSPALGWLAWDGSCFKQDSTEAVRGMAHDVCRKKIRLEAPLAGDLAAKHAAKEGASAKGIDEARKAAEQQVMGWASKSESTGRVSAMVREGLAIPGVSHDVVAFDRDPWLFNCPNGTLDLRTGDLRPHDRADLITRTSPVPYVKGAQAPRWRRFLHEVFPGPEGATIVDYLQRLVGYALTGSVREQVAVFCVGDGSDGKSVFFNVVRHVLGPYARAAPSKFLEESVSDQHPTELADLRGIRWLACQETEEGKRLAEQKLKQLTGGDPIKARFMRQDWFEFMPTHQIVVACNHRPVIMGTDHGIWRRIHVVPFTQQFKGDEADKGLTETLYAEAAGILVWAVEGCMAWQRAGLLPPRAVLEHVQAYRREMDTLAAFVEERCVLEPGASVERRDLYIAYGRWCEENGYTPWKQPTFTRKLGDRRFDGKKLETSKVEGERKWIGLRLRLTAAGSSWVRAS